MTAPEGDGKPVAWAYEVTYGRASDTWYPHVNDEVPEDDYMRVRNITPLYAHPPSDTIEQAIKELPEGWQHSFSCVIWHIGGEDPDDEEVATYEEHHGTGPDPLSAMRAAVSRINPERKEG